MYSIKVIKKLISKIVDYAAYRILKIEWHFVIDLGIVSLSYVTAIYWFSFTFGIFTIKGVDVKLPISENEFQDYADLSYTTTDFKVIVSVGILLVFIRVLK